VAKVSGPQVLPFSLRTQYWRGSTSTGMEVASLTQNARRSKARAHPI
jgi:hypothetical protein